MNVAEQLEKLTRDAVAERDKLKSEAASARATAGELKDALKAVRAERDALRAGLAGMIQEATREAVTAALEEIKAEHGRALRHALVAVERELRALA